MSPDPAIKLFGQTIPFPLHDGITTAVAVDGDEWEDLEASSPQEKRPKEAQGEEQEKKAESNVERTETKEREQTDPISMSEESAEPATTSVTNSSPQTPSVEKENANTNAPKHDEGENEASITKEKAMKKPDKILHCPRCNSLETKFCYYNNYNVNQPRHFCKNCQRYWTAGGTMRNVPVGAGRRKTKTSSLNYQHISVSEALQAAQNGIPEAAHQPPLKPNGTVLSFGSDVPLCESTTSVLNIAEKTLTNCRRSGFHHHTEEQKFPNSCEGCENGEEHSSGSSVTTSNSAEEGNQANLQEHAQHNCQPFPPQLPCFPGAPWSYPWNSTQWGSPVAPAAFCASSFPVSFYPTPAYWNCITGTWTVPWLSPPPPSNAGSSGSCTNSPTLGKHSRDGNMLKQSNSVKQETVKQNNSERCLWIPKTLRIDDPEEAAKSSIWTTLGIRNEKTDTVTGGRLFKGFQSKVDDRKHMTERSPVLHANPAALSRSLKFHESSQVGTDQSERHDRKHMTERSPVLHANPAALSRSLKFHESSQVGTDQSERHDLLI